MPQPESSPELNEIKPAKDSKFPAGIILILILTGFSMIGMISGLINPMILIGNKMITGLPAFLYNTTFFVLDILLFVWLVKRNNKGRILGIFKAGYNIFISFLTYVSFYFNTEEFMANYEKLMPGYSDFISPKFVSIILILSIMLSLLIGGAVIVYLVLKKHHFRT